MLGAVKKRAESDFRLIVLTVLQLQFLKTIFYISTAIFIYNIYIYIYIYIIYIFIYNIYCSKFWKVLAKVNIAVFWFRKTVIL